MRTPLHRRLAREAPASICPVRRRLGGLYAPELLEARIAPATFIVNSLLDNGDGANTTLREAVEQANLTAAADTIKFDPTLPAGTIVLNGAEIAITGTLTIKGPGPDKLTISGNNASRIFNIADGDNAVLHPTSISGLALRDANFAGAGGAIVSTESLALTNVIVHSNTSAGSGGGVLVLTLGKVSLSKVTFSENVSSLGSGGGLFAQAERGVVVSKSLFAGNSARQPGGGMYLSAVDPRASFVVDGTSFIDNTSTNFGGGGLALLNASNGKITVKNSTFTDNTAAGPGGALLLSDGALAVNRSWFSGNSSDRGGAIADMGGDSLKISGSRFERNASTGDGGAVHGATGALLTIKSSILSGNTAAANGGAIALAGAGTSLVLAASTVSGNTGVDGGGLFAGTGAKLTVTGGVFSANSASSDGGGIATVGNLLDAVKVSIAGTLFQGNRAANGGAVDTDGDGTVLIKSARVLGNHATGFGGGLYLRSSTSVVIQSSLFQHNAAAGGDGGGVVIDLDSALAVGTITGTKILDNFAGDDSGGLAAFGAAGSVLTLKRSLVSGNVAGTQAGGMRIGGTTVNLIATIIAGNWAPVAPNVFP